MTQTSLPLLLTATLLITSTTFGCKTPTPTPDDKITARPSDQDPIDMDGSSASFANSPCGSADWSKLPKGMDPAKAETKE